MPTSYTVLLEEKEVSFKDFALRCARAFGFLIEMRDEPLDKEIPKEFKPSDYYVKALAKAEATLAEVKSMGEDKCLKMAKKELENKISSLEKYAARDRKLLERYKRMQAKVEAWIPPTEDHQALKKFMLDQLHLSIPDPEYYEKNLQEKKMLIPNAKAWKKAKIEDLNDDIKYYTKRRKQEIELARKSTEWMQQLRKSLE